VATRFLKRKEAKQALGDMPERSFARWVAKGLPRKGDGGQERYPWPEIHRWMLEHARQEGRESVRPADYEDAKARKAMAEAELAELDLAQQRHELMTVEVAEKTLGEAFQRIRGQLLALPRRLAPDVVGVQTLPEANARLTKAIAEVLEELADGKDVPDGEEVDAAAPES
jgi:phage terminase Nu1 subunit (DNA packaging protein)